MSAAICGTHLAGPFPDCRHSASKTRVKRAYGSSGLRSAILRRHIGNGNVKNRNMTTSCIARPAHSYPTAVAGHGATIRDADGKEYIDASGGAAVSCLGHGHPDVLAAMHAQLDQLAYAHTSFFTSQVAEELADDLVAHAPDGLGHVFYVSGGSEAVEAALKLARQYFRRRGEPQRRT